MITKVITTSGHLIPKFLEVRFHRTRIFNYFRKDFRSNGQRVRREEVEQRREKAVNTDN